MSTSTSNMGNMSNMSNIGKPIGRLLKATGEVADFVSTSQNGYPSLSEMQATVGGYIERIKLPVFSTFDNLPIEPLVMIVNEEGHIRSLPINVQASMLAQQHIVGDVIV